MGCVSPPPLPSATPSEQSATSSYTADVHDRRHSRRAAGCPAALPSPRSVGPGDAHAAWACCRTRWRTPTPRSVDGRAPSLGAVAVVADHNRGASQATCSLCSYRLQARRVEPRLLPPPTPDQWQSTTPDQWPRRPNGDVPNAQCWQIPRLAPCRPVAAGEEHALPTVWPSVPSWNYWFQRSSPPLSATSRPFRCAVVASSALTVLMA